MIKHSELKVGDRIENYRTQTVYVITEIGCYHGDEIAFVEITKGAPGIGEPRHVESNYAGRTYTESSYTRVKRVQLALNDRILRKCLKTFRQWDRLKFLRREG